VNDATEGRAVLTEDGLTLDGEQMPEAWHLKAVAEPDSMKVLVVSPGDRVRVEGDEEAKDGIYIVGDVDNADVEKRVMVESEDPDAEDWFMGFVANTSIKQIIKE